MPLGFVQLNVPTYHLLCMHLKLFMFSVKNRFSNNQRTIYIYIYKTLSTRQHRIIKLRICFFPKMVFLFLTGRQKLYHLNNLYVIRLFYRFEFQWFWRVFDLLPSDNYIGDGSAQPVHSLNKLCPCVTAIIHQIVHVRLDNIHRCNDEKGEGGTNKLEFRK